MTDNELKRLSRTELLRLLVNQMRRNKELEAQLEEANMKLQQREIDIAECGTLAEAAMRMNGLFEQADKAVKDYIYNVMRYYGHDGGSQK